MSEKSTAAGLPALSKSTIWMINFGFLGVQTAFTLQSSQMSRIFQTIGADPNNLGWFFILPPLMGLVVQPIVGYYSDRTWAPKLGGRRLPYLLLGMIRSRDRDVAVAKLRELRLRLRVTSGPLVWCHHRGFPGPVI
jgi:hypothetical protein